jgi:hypothetical protein
MLRAIGTGTLYFLFFLTCARPCGMMLEFIYESKNLFEESRSLCAQDFHLTSVF